MYALAVYCIHKVLFLHKATPLLKPKSKMKRKRNYLKQKTEILTNFIQFIFLWNKSNHFFKGLRMEKVCGPWQSFSNY